MIKKVRILILLYILLMVALSAYWTKQRSTDWNDPLVVAIYPVNGDGTEATTKYIEMLDKDTFTDIEDFFSREAKRYQLAIEKPVVIHLAKQINEHPPTPPRDRASVLSIMAWSLKMRYWSWRIDNHDYPKDIQVFTIYFDPNKTSVLAHSLGLQKGLIGVVNVFASRKMKRENHVIIAHELLHTLGATDKYDPETNQPLYPKGYANPEQQPLFPQKKAEIMAGRIAISQNKAEQPAKLKQVTLGEATATEINWSSTAR